MTPFLSPLARRIAGAMLLFVAGPAGAQTRAVEPQKPTVRLPAGQAQAESATRPLDRLVSLEFQDARLEDVLDAIDQQTGIGLQYTPRAVPVDKRVTIHMQRATVRAALVALLKGTKVEIVEAENGGVMLVRREPSRTSNVSADSTQGLIWGQVLDSASGRPIEGVQVGVPGTVVAAVSNDSGYYLLRPLAYGPHTVVARRLGYEAMERVFIVIDSLVRPSTRLDIRLRLHAEKMQQVIVTATGAQRRLEVANDITTINVDSVMRMAPVRSVTDLLETRVPGLEVEHTSGNPGDPARIRLRGLSSLTRNNDPIVVLDGVRIDVSESGNHNLAPMSGFIPPGWSQQQVVQGGYTAPSRLDQIDPSSIETIEVFKGPSAAALYGPDAANGVIVITTKRARPGPARWQYSVTQGLTTLPGRYPVGLFRWGHDIAGGTSILCPRVQFNCVQDSLVAFQALNDPRYRPFSDGNRTAVNASVSGGTEMLRYSFSGSGSQEVGLLQLPGVEVARYEKFQNAAPPSWMQRPDHFTTWGGTSQLTATLSPKARVTVITTLSSRDQQQSDLQTAVATLEGQYVDPSQLAQQPLLDDFYERASSKALDFTNIAQVSWEPWAWLPITANLGLNIGTRTDETFLPPHLRIGVLDSAGHFGLGSGRLLTKSANIGTNIPLPLPLGMRVTTALGMNLTAISSTSQRQQTYGLVDGEDQPSALNGSQQTSDVATLGWYVAPTFAISPRFYLSTGYRLDGGSTSGTHATFNGFPKLGASWLVSDERFFPAALRTVFNTLRLRVAYGHAGVQPGLTDRLRLYTSGTFVPPGGDTPAAVLGILTIGNTKLRPERSTELEGGFDTDLFSDRVSISYSGYVKVREDALISIPVAPSAHVGNQTVNLGEVRNTGAEASLNVGVLRSELVSWQVNVNFSTNTNKLVRLAPGQQPITVFDGVGQERFVPGYPLYGRWAKPIVGWVDRNQDGIIDPSEVLVGDTAVYVGQPLPRYHASLATTVGLFRNRVTIDATFDYQNGQSQFSAVGSDPLSVLTNPFALAANDPRASLAAQAGIAALAQTPYALIQTVNLLRFNSLAVSVAMPDGVARVFQGRSIFVTLRGANLGLHSNYHGLDPSVNAGELGQDFGQVPQPRTWELSVHVGN